MPGWFETPKPKNFRKIHPYDHRWITEIAVLGNDIPRHPNLGTYLLRSNVLLTNSARTGRSGIAFFCPNIAYLGGDIDTVLVRPTLFIPDAMQVVEHLCKYSGMACKVSDKGFYTQDIIRKVGDLATLATFLRDPIIRAVLEKFLDKTRPGQGVEDEGIVLRDRRYVNLLSVAKILGDHESCRKIIDRFVAIGLFHRGFVFHCRFCRAADWFAVGEVTEEFSCKRCSKTQKYTSQNFKANEPEWFYKLDEIPYLGLENNMQVPLLALDCLRRRSKRSFMYTTDLEIIPQDDSKPTMEIDICCIVDGILTIGEAKTQNRLDSSATREIESLTRYRDLARKILPRRVVFATWAERWSDTTQERIREAFTELPVEVNLLESRDLLS
ncbi:MAG TPA: hypothetical protein VGL29_12765 [Blastocatellia bacterium]